MQSIVQLPRSPAPAHSTEEGAPASSGSAESHRPAPAPKRPLGRRLTVGGVGLAIAVAVIAYGIDWWRVGRFLDSTDDAYVGADVTVIAPNVAGLLTRVAVIDNQEVHRGDLLATIDDRTYRATLAKANAAVDAQKALLANLQATRHLQQSVIAQSDADVAATDAEVDRTQADQTRYRALLDTAATTPQTFQKADADYRRAMAIHTRSRASVEAAQRQLSVLDTRMQEVRAALAGAIADRDRAALDVGYTELRSPIDGTVGRRSARLGAFAAVGAQLMAIVPAHGLWVDANFKENQLAHMRPGLPVKINADVLPSEALRGHVVSLAPATGAQFSLLPAENATGNFTKIVQRVPIRIALDGDAADLGRLRPGLSVIAQVDERSAR